jgi:hypothetical protein
MREGRLKIQIDEREKYRILLDEAKAELEDNASLRCASDSCLNHVSAVLYGGCGDDGYSERVRNHITRATGEHSRGIC